MQKAEEVLSEYQPSSRPKGSKTLSSIKQAVWSSLQDKYVFDYKRKKICALRSYFLLIQKERCKYLRHNIRHLYEGSISILKKEIHFWRKKKKKKKKLDKQLSNVQ